MFKFDLKQTVFYLLDSRVHSAPVLSRMLCDNFHEDWNSTAAQKDTFTHWGPGGTYYRTIHGVFSEERLYASRADLAHAIINGSV